MATKAATKKKLTPKRAVTIRNYRVLVSNCKPRPGEKVIRGWHWLGADGVLSRRSGANTKVQVGKTYSIPAVIKRLQPCSRGLHASKNLSDVMSHTNHVKLAYNNLNRWLCRVEVWGNITEETCGDKFVGRHRRVVFMLPVKPTGLPHARYEQAVAIGKALKALGFGDNPEAC